ncbi:Polyadenylate-binding protein [Spironucleus salmonicida]|uniref:Polyadenylate-binding protein n=1 Tax=Spironucleus salmonicida TaxID=348837 RepID=V6LEA5_9EUKA|nr:Polyadenylate-binding protein [Spironucleus salmonicida]|eukprot:EST42608.1 Polyadenylate-binding protein [Spironucleus salmonicida]
MSNIIVNNIPEKFTVEQLFSLLDQANIPCSNRNVKIVKSNRTTRQNYTGRYCILNLESDVIAQTAIQAINQIVVTVESKEVQIRAMIFLPNFRALTEDPSLNIVVYNLPLELSSSDLYEIFADFGTVLSTSVNKKDTSNMGYVLFDKAETAVRAIQEADGKYLGPSKIIIKPFRTIEDRQRYNTEILVFSAGAATTFTSEAAAQRITEILPFVQFDGDICIRDDPRPAEVNCGGAAWIFTCKDHTMAARLISELNDMSYTFEGVNEPCRSVPKLSKGMLAKAKAQEQTRNREQFQESGANVQVFGLKMNTTEAEVRSFMEKFGDIENISAPRMTADIAQDLFHYNVLYKNSSQAEKAIAEATQLEQSLPERLSDNQLRVIKYTAKKEVKSTTRRGKDQEQRSGPM